ncbi:metalloregulator ArsR/SmtB family transcription factor [Agreia sp. VKM Ac-1783]|jgi:DNA-binding transcriptional ArsR family regulator|uniref:ArsR/SmtB family transcription factor n=1 Tax=Agreia sp. VKM Ac-1783 TaxID=1938889 RepID=UPI000A2ABA8A|nr:metalloregulator ArsR/SmtB family transcription factor [Agreia sp. VKM Ac-1783]SMQ57746.1 Helix-turn-helix domain-containing protein [Agreia sp. VKM Ac-1783]
MADIFSVIADPTRRHLLELLLERYTAAGSAEVTPHAGESSVSELVHALDLSQPTVSKHLKVLRDAGLVAVREEGQHRYYKLDASPLEEVEDWAIPFLSADFDGSLKDDDAEWADTNTAGQTPDAAGSASEFARNVGRTVATSSHQARAVVEDLQANATRLVSRLRK